MNKNIGLTLVMLIRLFIGNYKHAGRKRISVRPSDWNVMQEHLAGSGPRGWLSQGIKGSLRLTYSMARRGSWAAWSLGCS